MDRFIKYISYRQFLPHVLSEIGNHVDLYSTVIFKRQGAGSWEQAGSGTLVMSGGRYGILTAGHVVTHIQKSDSIGLVVSHEDHCYAIDASHLSMSYEYNGASSNRIPDIGLILIPEEIIGSIEARNKLFYDMDRRIGRAVEIYEDLHQGIWVLWGSPDELTRYEPSSRISGDVACLQCLSSFTSVEVKPAVGGIDILAASVNLANCSEGVPRSFTGFSGGGLWNVRLTLRKSGEIESADYLLVGVAYYQSELTDHKREIFCHGPYGIEALLPRLRANCR